MVNSPRRGVARWLLVLVLVLVAGVAPAWVPVAADNSGQDNQQVNYREDPLAKDAYTFRNKANKGKGDLDPWKNVASFYVDLTGLDVEKKVQILDRTVQKLRPRPVLDREVLDVNALRTENPDLYAALNPGSGVTTILRITAFNYIDGVRNTDPTKNGSVHSERLLYDLLLAMGIDIRNGRLVAVYSERQPCEEKGCNLITNYAKRLRWSFHYGTKEEQQQAALELAEGFYWLEHKTIFDPPGISGPCPNGGNCDGPVAPGTPTAAGPAEEILGRRPDDPEDGANPGGVDFSTLQLRYVSATSGGSGLDYSFAASTTTGPANVAAGQDAMREASDAFFVWLELDPSRFTVNLNPTEPDRIIDTDLGHTDAGRVLLQADFQMKKTVATLIHPDTPLGAQYWQQLQAGPDGRICVSMRQWIVPAPATVREDGDKLYILDAPLNVELESDYLNVPNAPQYNCGGQDQSIQQHNEAVFRTMILPRVQDAVNQAPEFADLRRVYLSRVAAEWYRQRSSLARKTTYGKLIDQGDIGPWSSHTPWNPKDIFNAYVQSYTNGEFNVTHQTQEGDTIFTSTYVFGGVDFTKVPEIKLSGAQFTSKAPGLQGEVQRSISRPVRAADGQTAWLGGSSVVNPPPPPSPTPLLPPLPPLGPLLAGLIGTAFMTLVIGMSWLIVRSISGTRPPAR